MKTTRRNLLALGGGAMAGLAFTPVPWKLLDDVSIWTQNWPWIPQPRRGPVDVKHTSCALCPGGCGLRIRLAGGWPVGVAGTAGHPLSGGALCPLAFGAHQLNWHVCRLRQVRHRGRISSWPEALAAFRKACAEGPVAIVDGRPGRAASRIFEKFADRRKGSYAVVHAPEEKALLPYQKWSGVPVTALGYDLESAGTILSFGAPLLDGWGTPGRFARLWSAKAAGNADPALRLIQVEPVRSRTAAAAWRWIPTRPGTEAAFAAGLVHALGKGPRPAVPMAEAAAQSGVALDSFKELAETILARPPVLAISAGDQPAVAALNLLLGGRIVERAEHAPVYPTIEQLKVSPRAVLVDSTVAWQTEPATDAEVFRFAAWDGGGSRADWLLPAPGFLEELTDVPTPPGTTMATYAVAPDLVPPVAGISSSAAFLARIDEAVGSVADAVHARCEELWRARAGSLHQPSGGDPVPVDQLESAAKLYDELRAGAVWMAAPGSSQPLRCELREWPAAAKPQPALDWTAGWIPAVLPPLAGKLFQESDLRELPARSKS